MEIWLVIILLQEYTVILSIKNSFEGGEKIIIQLF